MADMADLGIIVVKQEIVTDSENESEDEAVTQTIYDENIPEAVDGDINKQAVDDKKTKQALKGEELTDAVIKLIGRAPTRRSTMYSLVSWEMWMKQKNVNLHKTKIDEDEAVPDFNTVCTLPIPKMDDLLAAYISETRGRDGQEYVEESIKGLAFGLQRYVKCFGQYMKKTPISIMSNELQFPKFYVAFQDRLAKEITSRKPPNTSKWITQTQELSLWNRGIFGIDSAQALSDTIFFYTVKIFGLSSSNLMRLLQPEDFTFSKDEYGDYVELNKDFGDRGNLEPLTIYNHAIRMKGTNQLRHYCNVANPRTYFNLISFYMEIIKLVPAGQSYGFFLSPQSGMQFKSVAIGRNVLQRKFGLMMQAAGFSGNFTNQGLVQSFGQHLQQSGYRVRKHITFSIEEQLNISRILDPPPGIVDTSQIEKAISQHLCQVGQLTNAGGKEDKPSSSRSTGIPLSNSLAKIIQGNDMLQPTTSTQASTKPHSNLVKLVPVKVAFGAPNLQEKILALKNTPKSNLDEHTNETHSDNVTNVVVKQEPVDPEGEVASKASAVLAAIFQSQKTPTFERAANTVKWKTPVSIQPEPPTTPVYIQSETPATPLYIQSAVSVQNPVLTGTLTSPTQVQAKVPIPLLPNPEKAAKVIQIPLSYQCKTDIGNQGKPILTYQGKPVFEYKGNPILENQGKAILENKGKPIGTYQGKPVFEYKGNPIIENQGVLENQGQAILENQGVNKKVCSVVAAKIREKSQEETLTVQQPPAKKQKLSSEAEVVEDLAHTANNEEEVENTAVIEYSVTTDQTRNVYKQEINVTDNDHSIFSFSGSNKMGKTSTSSDLDINLGDYLPENCTIKPSDINVKRMVLADGGKLVFSLKYSLPK